MVMKRIMENFKYFVRESTEMPDFKFEAILKNARTKERGKQDILNDIRALKGITVVYIVSAEKPRAGEDMSLLSLKVDRYVLGHASVSSIISELVKNIKRMDGVLSFAVKGIPEQI